MSGESRYLVRVAAWDNAGGSTGTAGAVGCSTGAAGAVGCSTGAAGAVALEAEPGGEPPEAEAAGTAREAATGVPALEAAAVRGTEVFGSAVFCGGGPIASLVAGERAFTTGALAAAGGLAVAPSLAAFAGGGLTLALATRI